MNSSDLYIVSLKDPRDNHDRLFTFLIDVIKKYNESRQCSRKNRRCSAIRTYVRETEIDTATQINSGLFVNALLYYIFSEAGIGTMLLDKHGRIYPSNVFSKLYKASWQREITASREVAFRKIHDVCCEILEQSDMEFASFIDHVVVLHYLNACVEHEMPAYTAETHTYSQQVNNVIMEWAAAYADAVIAPRADEAAFKIKKQKDDIITALQAEALPTMPEMTQEASATTISEPVQSAEETTQTVELTPAGPKELAEAFKAVCVALEKNWSAELKKIITDLLAPAEEQVKDLSNEIAALQAKKDRMELELRALNTLMCCWDAKAN